MSVAKAGASPVLEVRALSRYFGPRVALENIHFHLQSAEIKFINGANGAGKSTLLAILAGLLAASKGEMLLHGKHLKHRKREHRSELGYAGERAFLYGDLTLQESLSLFARAGAAPATTLRRCDELMDALGLEDSRHRRLRECSQGTLRRAGLVRAFLFSPKLMLLDEPFSHLDHESEARLLELVKKEQQAGTCFLIAAHETHLQEKLGGSLLRLAAGRQLAAATEQGS